MWMSLAPARTACARIMLTSRMNGASLLSSSRSSTASSLNSSISLKSPSTSETLPSERVDSPNTRLMTSMTSASGASTGRTGRSPSKRPSSCASSHPEGWLIASVSAPSRSRTGTAACLRSHGRGTLHTSSASTDQPPPSLPASSASRNSQGMPWSAPVVSRYRLSSMRSASNSARSRDMPEVSAFRAQASSTSGSRRRRSSSVVRGEVLMVSSQKRS